MKTTMLLVLVLAAIAAGGFVYLNRPEREPSLPTPVAPSASPVDNTTPWPPPNPAEELAQNVQPINQTVTATLVTSQGNIDLTLDGGAAPLTVGNFVALAQADFYDGTTFHRVIPDFMIQGGDPISKDPNQRPRHGTGGPGYSFPDEINSSKVVRGALAMANSGPNTNGSQFFIVVGDAFPHLDGLHTVFGQVTAGMDIVDAIVQVEADERDNPATPVVIQDVVISGVPAAPGQGLQVE